MKYKAVRPYRGREGDIRAGQVIDIDERRAAELGRLVEPAEDAPAAKAEPGAPSNKAEPGAPSNKSPVTVEGTGAVRRGPGRPKKQAE
jgi:hypothetical protein